MGLGLGRRAGLALLLLVAVAGVPGIRALRLASSGRALRVATLTASKRNLMQRSFQSNSFGEEGGPEPLLDDQPDLEGVISTMGDLRRESSFLLQAGLIGLCTAIGVVVFKLSIQETSKLLYENLASVLPKPAFYWPQVLYPVIGAAVVSLLTYIRGQNIRRGVESIAQSIDCNQGQQGGYSLGDQVFRLAAAVATLGSGCSLGPEGPAVEIGAGLSRLVGSQNSARQQHHLFLAGTAAGVAAGFNAPIAGVFFAIECGNRFLKSNTVRLDEEAPDGPRGDIAAIVTAAAVAKVVVELGLKEKNALSIQGNLFAMESPLELPLYLGLGVLSGIIAVSFTTLRDYLTIAMSGEGQGGEPKRVLSSIPLHFRPLLGGLLCGLAGLFYPQTVFVGYSTLDQLLAGKIHLDVAFLIQLLAIKIALSSFSLASGLVGGVFAPSLFFGSIAGTAYHDIIVGFIGSLNESSGVDLSPFIASAPAYATVGAACTLGALFRAPLTATILMLELTENHDIVIPVLLSSGIAGFLSEILRKKTTPPPLQPPPSIDSAINSVSAR